MISLINYVILIDLPYIYQTTSVVHLSLKTIQKFKIKNVMKGTVKE